jgi:hypothetical protein
MNHHSDIDKGDHVRPAKDLKIAPADETVDAAEYNIGFTEQVDFCLPCQRPVVDIRMWLKTAKQPRRNMCFESLAYCIAIRSADQSVQVAEINPIGIAQEHVLESNMRKLLIDVGASTANADDGDLAALKNALRMGAQKTLTVVAVF